MGKIKERTDRIISEYKALPKDAKITLCMMVATGILIILTGIIYKQSFFNMLPLFVSLFISFLQTRVNRYAPLMGGINSILYAIVYGFYHLYGMMAYAALVSCPLQLITFYNWNRKPYGNSTILRRLTGLQRLGVAAGFAACWIAVCLILRRIGSDYEVLDTTVTMMGILSTVLMMFSFIEFNYLSFPGQIISIILYVEMLREHPEQITYLIYTIYCSICVFKTFIRLRDLYKEQNSSN